jgi:hypothetical protein
MELEDHPAEAWGSRMVWDERLVLPQFFSGRGRFVTSIRTGAVLRLSAAYADIIESHGAQALRIQQILGVDDDRFLQQALDAVEI